VSPLARALMKAGPEDTVTLRAPGGTETLEILEVRYRRIDVAPFVEPAGAESVATRGAQSRDSVNQT
jgi:transcription elongation factor GreB